MVVSGKKSPKKYLTFSYSQLGPNNTRTDLPKYCLGLILALLYSTMVINMILVITNVVINCFNRFG